MRSAGRRRKPCFPSIQQITTSKPCLRGLAAALSNSCAAQELCRRCALRPERFEGNHRRNRYERITPFVETFIASDQIEEAKLSHVNIPRSESRSFESDLRAGWKGEFFEVPNV